MIEWTKGQRPDPIPGSDEICVVRRPEEWASFSRRSGLLYGDQPEDGNAVNAEAALRLLAAEASDRHCWNWRIQDHLAYAASRGKIGVPGNELFWRPAEPSGKIELRSTGTLTDDELLAALHGRYLLEAAMKEKV